MTPEKFIATWQNNPLTERAGAQAHFDDLCDLLGVEKPRDPENYCFERGAKKAGGGDGWADVWKRGCFGWENKKPGRDLDAALKQLTDYALYLDNPPLLVVSDRERIIIHTAFTGYPDQPRVILIEELKEELVREQLRWVFEDPARLRPEQSTAAITGEAAGKFAELAEAMRNRGTDGQQTAHFLVQCLFCMFAEDEGLLPGEVFTSILENCAHDPAKAARRIAKLFAAMARPDGEYGDHDIPWFNGGLFATIAIPALTASDLQSLQRASQMDWRAIDPTIFGTLFERSLDPAARAPLGAHYTDTATIRKLITPLITEPLLAQWEQAGKIIATGAGKGPKTKARKDGDAAWQGFTAQTPVVPGPGPGLRFRQFPVPGARGPARRRTPRLPGSARTGRISSRPVAADRPPQHPRHRDQRIRRRAGPDNRLDRRSPVAAAQRPADQQQTDPQPARRHRTSRRPA